MIRILAAMMTLVLFLPGASGAKVKNDEEGGAYYDYKNWQCRIDGNSAVLKVQYKMTVLNARGNDYAGFNIQEGSFSKVTDINLKVVDAAGNIIQVDDKKTFTKMCGFGPGWQVYDDVCHYSKDIEYSKYPYSVLFEYTLEMKSIFFWGGAGFQNAIPVRHASYELDIPADFKFTEKISGSVIARTVSENKGRRKYLWQADSLSALDDEKYLPDGYPEGIWIDFMAEKMELAGYKFAGGGWGAIGKWYCDLARNCYSTTAVPEGPTSGSGVDRRPEIEAIYNEVVDKFRYVLVSIGISGWKPAQAGFTEQKGFGDCKGLSTLLISRLRAKGVPAFPVLALTRGDGKLSEDFPNFGFNHVFVMAPDGEDSVWMDPTCNECRLGDLPAGDENIPVLAMVGDSGVLIHTPSSHPNDNRLIKSTQGKIDAKGTLSLESQFQYFGNRAQYLKNRLQHDDRDGRDNLVGEIFPGGARRYSILNYDMANLTGIAEPLTLTVKSQRKKPLDRMNNILYIDPGAFEDADLYETLKFDDRVYPVDLGYPRLSHHEINVALDSTLAVDSITVPPDDSSVCRYGYFKCTYSRDGRSFKMTIERSRDAYTLPVDAFIEFAAYRDHLKEILVRPAKIYLVGK